MFLGRFLKLSCCQTDITSHPSLVKTQLYNKLIAIVTIVISVEQKKQHEKGFKEHIIACDGKFLRLSEKEKGKIYVKIINVVKKFAIAEHLVNNQSCAENFNFERNHLKTL